MLTDLPPHRSPGAQPRVAVVGAGIAGLAVAHTLQGLADVSLFEALDRFGGDIHTVEFSLPDARGVPLSLAVDTGFLVVEESRSPNSMALFAQLGVPLARADMSYTVRSGDAGLDGGGSDLLARAGRLLHPRRWWLQTERLRFERALAALGEDAPASLADVLRSHRLSNGFRDGCLLPLLGAAWAGPPAQALDLPAAGFARWGRVRSPLLARSPERWWTVAGGARQCVNKIVAAVADRRPSTPVRHVARDAQGLRIVTDRQVERFDAAVLACGAPQALALLGDGASPREREVLGAVRSQAQRVVLHTDAGALAAPQRHWATWNFEHLPADHATPARIGAHLWLNRLAPLPVSQAVLLSLNPPREIAAASVLGEWERWLPVFDRAALLAQQGLPALQGAEHTWHAGAWCGDGSHEAGLKAGLHAARALIDRFGLAPRTDAAAALRAALPGVLA